MASQCLRMSAFLQGLSRHRIKLLGFLVVCILSAIVTCNLRQPQHDPRVDALRKGGYPVTLAELDQWYPYLPDPQNAALIYTNAFASMLYASSEGGGKNIGDIKPPSRNETLTADDKTELTEMIASNAVAFRLLYSAGQLTNSRYPIDFSKGFAMLLPHLAKIKGAVQLLRYKGVLHVANGEREEAFRSLLVAIGASESLDAEPLLISQLVRYACFAIVVKQLEYTENALPFSEPQLADLQSSLAEAEHRSAVERALAGELACDLAVFSDARQRSGVFSGPMSPASPSGPAFKERALVFALQLSGIFAKDRAYLMDTLMTNMAVAKLDYPERFQAGQKTAAAYGAAPNRLFILSQMLLPALGKFHTRDAEFVTNLRVAQTALAIERYRLAHNNALPSSLDELAPTYLKSALIDPCDGQPLRFKKLDKGYVVYGVGSDGTDEGGAERKGSSTAKYDITFTVER